MTPSQEAREGYPLLPEPAMEDVPSELWGQNVTYPALYTAEQMRSYVDADRKARQQEALTDEQITSLVTALFPRWREDIQESFVLEVARAVLAKGGHR